MHMNIVLMYADRMNHVLCVMFCYSPLYAPGQLIVGFTLLRYLLDKPWSPVSPLLPPVTCLHFNCARQCSTFPLLVIVHRFLLTRALALSAKQVLGKQKSLRYTSTREYVHVSHRSHGSGTMIRQLTSLRFRYVRYDHQYLPGYRVYGVLIPVIHAPFNATVPICVLIHFLTSIPKEETETLSKRLGSSHLS